MQYLRSHKHRSPRVNSSLLDISSLTRVVSAVDQSTDPQWPFIPPRSQYYLSAIQSSNALSLARIISLSSGPAFRTARSTVSLQSSTIFEPLALPVDPELSQATTRTDASSTVNIMFDFIPPPLTLSNALNMLVNYPRVSRPIFPPHLPLAAGYRPSRAQVTRPTNVH